MRHEPCVELKLHGFARDSIWAVAASSDTAATLTLTLTHVRVCKRARVRAHCVALCCALCSYVLYSYGILVMAL